MNERFWSKVSPPTEQGCKEWQGYRLPNGYGQFSMGGKGHMAHRIAWESANGPIPEGMIICHSCDNRACCNPDHLWLGTNKLNSEDMVRKLRAPNGERGGLSKLTDEQVLAIRNDTRTSKEIAKDFNCHWSSVAGIKSGKTWKHVGGKTVSRKRAVITAEIVRAIRNDSRPNALIGDELGLSFQQVSRIKRRERWAHID